MPVAGISLLFIKLVERGEALGLEAGAGRAPFTSLVRLIPLAYCGADVLLELLTGLR